jgi:hypothetical protein
MIGDLAFGESFDGLKNSTIHTWVAMIFQSVKLVTFLRTAQSYPLVMKLLLPLMPKTLTKAREEHAAYTRKVVMKRVHDSLARKTGLYGLNAQASGRQRWTDRRRAHIQFDGANHRWVRDYGDVVVRRDVLVAADTECITKGHR